LKLSKEDLAPFFEKNKEEGGFKRNSVSKKEESVERKMSSSSEEV
jgi:hypothetical protein